MTGEGSPGVDLALGRFVRARGGSPEEERPTAGEVEWLGLGFGG